VKPRSSTNCSGRDLAHAALFGLAIGDALGMPTQMLSRERIRELYGPGGLTGFEPAPPGHPIADGMPAGSVTDDTEQAVLLGRMLVAERGTLDPRRFAEALSDWEADMEARGSLDLLGPSTKRAVDAVRAGADPERTGLAGDTNGAAMRIAPVGIATPLSNGLGYLANKVQEASKVTHNTSIALAGAAAVAAAVSAGVGGEAETVADATEIGIEAARLAAKRGHWIAGADVAARIEWATGLVRGKPTSSTHWSAPAWRRRSRCPPRSRCSPRYLTTRGRPACWLPHWAATATRSPRSPGRSPGRATAPTGSRPRRSPQWRGTGRWAGHG
jgi:ADP-ribosylglycohydrolase